MKYDILSFTERNSTLIVEGNAVSALKNSSIQKHGVRRFENGKMYQASRIGSATRDQLLTDSREMGGPGSAHDYGFAPEQTKSRKSPASSKESVLQFKDFVQEITSRYPEFVFSGKYSLNNLESSFTSNYGVDLKSEVEFCNWYLIYQRRGSGNMLDGWLTEASIKPDFMSELKAHENFLTANLIEAPLKSGRIPVLFANPVDPIAKFLESVPVRRYFDGSCVFAGRLGEQIFSSKISLADQAYDPCQGFYQFFDGDGVVRKNDPHYLIEKGKFNALISDLRFGHKYNHPSTGNGIRSYNTGVSIGTHSLRFSKGTQPWREILKNIPECLVVMIAAGGDSNDLGEFSTPVQIGYAVRNGEIVGRAPQLTVKTSVSDYLGQSLIAVSSDGFTPSSPSACLISEMDILL